MGRSRKLLTDEDKIIARKKYCKTYYEKNKVRLNANSMEKYWKKVKLKNNE